MAIDVGRGRPTPFVTGEVVPNPGEVKPFLIVFVRDGEIIRSLPVENVVEGEELIIKILKNLGDFARAEAGLG